MGYNLLHKLKKRSLGMKKASLVVAAVVALVVGLSGCLSSLATTSGSGSSTSSSSSATSTLNLYLNVPRDDIYALAAEKLVIESLDTAYDGKLTFTYTGTLSVSQLGNILKYAGYCEGIKKAIESGHNTKCSLTYNTKADGSGTVLALSESEALRTVLMMALYNYNNIYAIYKF